MQELIALYANRQIDNDTRALAERLNKRYAQYLKKIKTLKNLSKQERKTLFESFQTLFEKRSVAFDLGVYLPKEVQKVTFFEALVLKKYFPKNLSFYKNPKQKIEISVDPERHEVRIKHTSIGKTFVFDSSKDLGTRFLHLGFTDEVFDIRKECFAHNESADSQIEKNDQRKDLRQMVENYILDKLDRDFDPKEMKRVAMQEESHPDFLLKCNCGIGTFLPEDPTVLEAQQKGQLPTLYQRDSLRALSEIHLHVLLDWSFSMQTKGTHLAVMEAIRYVRDRLGHDMDAFVHVYWYNDQTGVMKESETTCMLPTGGTRMHEGLFFAINAMLGYESAASFDSELNDRYGQPTGNHESQILDFLLELGFQEMGHSEFDKIGLKRYIKDVFDDPQIMLDTGGFSLKDIDRFLDLYQDDILNDAVLHAKMVRKRILPKIKEFEEYQMEEPMGIHEEMEASFAKMYDSFRNDFSDKCKGHYLIHLTDGLPGSVISTCFAAKSVHMTGLPYAQVTLGHDLFGSTGKQLYQTKSVFLDQICQTLDPDLFQFSQKSLDTVFDSVAKLAGGNHFLLWDYVYLPQVVLSLFDLMLGRTHDRKPSA